MSQCEAAESSSQVKPQAIDEKDGSPLDEVLREGAHEMLVKAVEAEVAAYIEAHQHHLDDDDRRLVVRNGHARERTIVSGVGQLKIQAPRVDDRRVDEQGRRFRFTSEILPPYLRRTKSVEELIPWLYLKGISTGDFSEALEALLGPDAPGLSATTVVRLKEVWRDEYQVWSKRDLSGQRFVYLWADGIYSNVRLDDERQCLLVVIGALEDGRKQLLAVHDGFRESELSWRELLENLKRRGLKLPPKLAVGDGGMGFWAALRQVFPATREQRCWLHKTANVLDKLPKSMQGKAKQALHDIYLAENGSIYLFGVDAYGSSLFNGDPFSRLYGVSELDPYINTSLEGQDLVSVGAAFGESFLYYSAVNPSTRRLARKVTFVKRVVVYGLPLGIHPDVQLPPIPAFL